MIRHVKFVTVPVGDQERALAFYRDKLGLEVVTDQPYDESWRWIELRIPGAETRLLLAGGTPGSEKPALVLVVDDLDQTFETLSAADVAFPQPPRDAPWGRHAILRDSEGNLVLLTRD